ncbi:restriction endonuclease subunit S [Corynebacterium sp.]|uniref:restriction endonuclease subunit S n=1 Tax=Corynebacterium sp. TaxID=1720 RepID=UPI002F3E8844
MAKLGAVADLVSSNVDKKARKGELPVRLINYTDVYYGSVLTPDMEYMLATAAPGQIERVGVKDGDVIFTKDSEAPDDIGIPALVREPEEDMVCGYHLTIARPRRSVVEPSYLYWYLCSAMAKNYWEQTANGVTRFSIGYSATTALPIALPPMEKQRAIADYLDRETAEIDAMSADLDEIEKLLTERRRATITAAFNQGLSTAPLWRFATVSPSTPGIYDLEKGEAATFIPLEDVWTNQNPGSFTVVPWEKKMASYTHFQNRDVLLPKVTPTVTHGRAMVARITTALGVVTSEVYTLRPDEKTNPDWLALFLITQTFLNEAGASVSGTGGLKRISTQFVQSFPVPDMNRAEQDELVEAVNRETSETDAMLADITELRDLLAERRAAVIAAAVTGQIDIPAAEETTHA